MDSVLALKSKFDEVLAMLKRAEDTRERRILLRQLQEIISETDLRIQQQQKVLRAMRKERRSS